jgi:hypothetical protein
MCQTGTLKPRNVVFEDPARLDLPQTRDMTLSAAQHHAEDQLADAVQRPAAPRSQLVDHPWREKVETSPASPGCGQDDRGYQGQLNKSQSDWRSTPGPAAVDQETVLL